jgi:hypothetical protein
MLDEITIITQRIFSYLSSQIDVNLGFSSINVKPFLDKENKKITIVITDLAGGLQSYYESVLTKGKRGKRTENQEE